MIERKYTEKIRLLKSVFLQILTERERHNKQELMENMQLIYGLYFSTIKLVKRTYCAPKGRMPILISVVRDEMERIGYFLNYYRQLGIRHFVIADNGSEDGTLEYLKKQPDVDVYTVRDKFKVGRKEGWINRLIYLYGCQKWYLVVDADEFLEWPERNDYSLDWVIRCLEAKKITRAGALMIDMYTRHKMFENELNGDLFQNFYFDRDTYTKIRDGRNCFYIGGPRKRVYQMDSYLSKYPLAYVREGEVLISAHYWYPRHRFCENPFIFGLLHYKFLTKTDLRKVKMYVNEGNHVNHSFEYKCYLKQYRLKNTEFYYEGSEKYEGPESIKKIKQIKRISKLAGDKQTIRMGR